MILAATGHRPDKLGGYTPQVENALCLLAHKYLAAERPAFTIVGMALGWDIAVAKASLLAGIPFIAAVPFAGQESKWPPRSQQIYRELLAQASRVDVVCPGGYAPQKMQRRNEYMVDAADKIIALWNGSAGGTANCLIYAQAKQKPFDNLWDQYKTPSP